MNSQRREGFFISVHCCTKVLRSRKVIYAKRKLFAPPSFKSHFERNFIFHDISTFLCLYKTPLMSVNTAFCTLHYGTLPHHLSSKLQVITHTFNSKDLTFTTK